MSSLYGQFFIYLLGNVGTRVAGFLMLPLYTRFLSPVEYGIVELIELCVQIMSTIIGMTAIGPAMIRIYYDYTDDVHRKQVVSSTVLLTAALCLFMSAVAFVSASWQSRILFHSNEYAWLMRIWSLSLVVAMPVEVFLTYLRMRNRAIPFVLSSAAQLLLIIGLNIYLIAMRGMGVWGFALSKLVTSAVAFVALASIIGREVGWKWKSEPTYRIIRLAAPLILGSLGFFAIHFSDRFFLVRYSTFSQIGLYALSYKFGFLVTYLAGEPFGKVWGVSMFNHSHGAGWEKEMARAGSYLIYTVVWVSLGIAALSGPFLHFIVTPAFMPAVTIIPLLVVAYMFREIGDFFRNLFYIKKRSFMISVVACISAAFNILLNFILISRWGVSGAAMATLLTWALYMLLCGYLAQKEHRIPLRAAYIGLLMAIACILFGMSRLAASLPVFAQLTLDCLIFVAFPILTWVSRCVPMRERSGIRAFFSALMAKVACARR